MASMTTHPSTIFVDPASAADPLALRQLILDYEGVESDITIDLTAVAELCTVSMGVIVGFVRAHQRRGWQCTYIVSSARLFRLLTLMGAHVALRLGSG